MISRDKLANLIAKQGLHLIGVVDLDVRVDFARFQRWLAEGKHAGMSYLERHHNVRADPRLLLDGARNAIVVGLPYAQPDKLNLFRQKEKPWLAQYARFKDYHKVLRKKLTSFVYSLQQVTGQNFASRICIDSAPLFERALASKAALGFVGKNSLFIHPNLGSFLLLAEVLTNLDLSTDVHPSQFDPGRRSKDLGGCGSCTRCQVHCPTGALEKDYSVDARLCISYWTIEHRGPIPLNMWKHLKDYVFGCDICQLVCPYNRGEKLEAAQPTALAREVDLEFLVAMDDSAYLQAFAGTPLIRAKREGLRRNAFIAMAVTKHPRLPEIMKFLENDPSPVIRETCRQAREAGYLV